MTLTHFLVLGLAAQRACGPYEMLKVLEQVNIRRWYPVSDASIYLAVRKLEARKLLAGTAVREGNNPEKTVYAITPKGEEELRATLIAHLESKETAPEAINAAILFICHLEKEIAIAAIERRITALKEEIAWSEALVRKMASDPEMPFIGRIMVQHGLATKKALLATLEELRTAAAGAPRWDYFLAQGAHGRRA